jgi:hypothetical protein
MLVCPNCRGELSFESKGCECLKCGFRTVYENGILCFHPEVRAAFDDYDPLGYARLRSIERNHFWFAARRKIIRHLVCKYGKKGGSVI